MGPTSTFTKSFIFGNNTFNKTPNPNPPFKKYDGEIVK